MNKPRGQAALERAQRAADKTKIKAEKEAARAAYEKARTEREQWATIRKATKEIKAGYRGAVSNRVSTSWSASQSVTGVVPLVRQVQTNLRDRARELERNNPIADGILTRSVENIIGPSGIKLQSKSSDDAWNKQAEALMTDWFPDADYSGLSWTQHQTLVMRSLLRDGDVASFKLTKGQLQLIEGDYIAHPSDKRTGYFYDGIEVDEQGRVVAYWHQAGDQPQATYTRVSKSDALFLARKKRVNQVRGDSVFSQTFTLFDQISQYVEATIIAQRIAACFGLIIKLSNPTAAISGLPYGTNADGNANREFTLEPGMIQTLNPNESIEQLKPEQPGRGFEANLRALLRLLGVNLGLPLELVLLDFSQTNYSSARASLQQAQRSFETLQNYFIEDYLQPVYRWRIQKFIDDGLLADRPDKFSHEWHAEPWPYLNPIQEIQADQLAVDAGFSTQTRELKKRGIEIEQWRSERAAEVAKNDEAGIPAVRSSLVAELTGSSEQDATATSNDQTENDQTENNKGDNQNEANAKAA